jgi:hypothetical protein
MLKEQREKRPEVYAQLLAAKLSANIKYKTSPRKCLKCDEYFQSYGKQNRMCYACKNLKDLTNGLH